MRREPIEYESLSIDEKSFHKGHSYLTVLSDPETGTVIDVGEGRTKKETKALINRSLNSSQQSKVKTVSMDMSKAYIHAIKEVLPDSHICFDKFHLVKYLNDAVDKVRRREVKEQEELIKTRYIWLKNPENLTEKQRLKFEATDLANYKTSRAWRIKENFRAIHFKQRSEEAFILLNQWIRNAQKCGMGQLIKVADMFDAHMQGIVNAMVYAIAERLNGKLQEIKLTVRGYRTFERFKSALLFFHGGLSLYPLKTQ
ncbi:MAG: ISL3 family transposase [Cytophagales bacterium]|nr:ISL3 family transposase [Cytophagales bacterium]